MKNHLYNKLIKNKQACIGFWSVIPSVYWIDVLASSQPDFIILDGEHGPVNFETALQLVTTCDSRGVSPIMRISGVNESECLKALDIGCHGIQIPNISTIQQAKDIEKYSKYPPLGTRGLSPFNRCHKYGLVDISSNIKIKNKESLNIIHIEGRAGIDHIDSLLDVEGIDVFFIGLFDISSYLGIPGDIENKAVVNLLETLTKKIISKNKICGSISNTKLQMNRLIDIGVNYITHSVDCYLAKRTFCDVVESFNESF